MPLDFSPPTYGEGELDEFEAATRAADEARARGDVFPPPYPIPTPALLEEVFAAREGRRPTPGIQGAPALSESLKRLLSQPARANPYDRQAALQSQGAQLALMEQMRAAQQGPSLASMQGQQGMAQLGQQSLMRGGRAGMLGAQGAGAGMAADVGRARLAEAMRLQAGVGSTAGGAAGRDLDVASAHQQAGLKMRGLDQDAQNFYRQQLTNLTGAQQNALLDDLKFKAARAKDREGKQPGEYFLKGAQTGLSLVGSVL